MAFAQLSDLALGRAQCAICVRVVRLWDYCGNKDGQAPLHVDMVLVDEKGNRMYAEIPGNEAGKFKAQICEGGVYIFRKFAVFACKAAYKPFQSDQMIRFTPWTTVQEKADMVGKMPRYSFDLVAFTEFPSRVGVVDRFIDTIGMIVGVSEVAYVHLPSSEGSTAKRVIALKDLRNNQINLVLWGSRATDFDAEGVHSVGQESPVVAIFVGMLLKSYKGENTLSSGSACKWYINEEIDEIEKFFDRMLDMHYKIEWISAGEKVFRALEQQKNLEEKTVMELRDMDPWEFEGSGYRCTVTISRVNNKQPWWFSSCTKCHRASVPCGAQYKCSGGCPCTTAELKYRLCLVGTDGTGTAEFTLFGRVARQAVGKPVIALIRSVTKNHHGSSGPEHEHMVPELAALVSHKFTFSVSISQKNLTQSTASSAVVLSPASYPEAPEASNAPKKPRLDRRTILCRRTLVLEEHSNGEKDTPILDKTDAAGITAAEEKKPDGVERSENQDNAAANDDATAIVPHDSPEPPLSSLKQRSGGGRKKSAA